MEFDSASPLRVTFLIRSLDYGGAESQLITLADGLQQRSEFETSILTFYPGGRLEHRLSEARVPIVTVNKRSRWDLAGFAARLVQAIRLSRPHVVYGFLDTPNVMLVLLKPFLGDLGIVWGIRSSYVDWSQYDWLARGTFRVSRYLSRFADRVVINSKAGYDLFVDQGYPQENLCVVANGIDTDQFIPQPDLRHTQRHQLYLDHHAWLIGIVGRLDAMKDHPSFIAAAALSLRERNDLRFLCVGDGREDYLEQLRMQADEAGIADRLQWLRSSDDMVSIYNGLDLLTLTSVGEGFPNVVGEAMACGVACVVTDVGDAARIVGGTGIVVPPRDPHAMACGWLAMIERLEKNREAIARQSRARIIAHFDRERLIESSANVLRTACA